MKQIRQIGLVAFIGLGVTNCAELDPPKAQEPVVKEQKQGAADIPATPEEGRVQLSQEVRSDLPEGFSLFTDGQYQLVCRKAEPVEINKYSVFGPVAPPIKSSEVPENIGKSMASEPSTEIKSEHGIEVKADMPATSVSPQSQVAEDTPDVISEKPSLAEDGVKEESGADQKYYVTTPILNVRSGPSMGSKVIRRLKKGDEVRGHGREGIWIMVGPGEFVSINFLKETHPLTSK